ncbi:MAG: immunoglobulin domain-containing protein [Cytophagaceae bacterium]
MRLLALFYGVVLSFSITFFGAAQTFQSLTQVGGIHINKIIDIETDASGNTYIVGSSRNTVSTPTNSGQGSTATKEQTFLAKITSAGTVAWLHHITTGAPSGVSKGVKIKVDNSGNVYMICNIAGTTNYFQPFFNANTTINVSATSAKDGALAKYDANGTFVWARAFGDRNSGEDQISDLVLDSNGDIYVTGWVNAGSSIYGRDFGSAQTTYANFSVTGSLDGYVAKFNGSGALQWNFLLGNTGADKGTALAIDGSDNLYVAGQFFGSVDMDPGTGTQNAVESTPQGTGDAFISKYTSAGSYVWHGVIEGVNEECVTSMNIGSSGLLNVGGYVQGTGLPIDFDIRGAANILTKNTVDNMDGFIAQYNLATQAPVFAKIIGGSQKDSICQVVGDGSSNIYVTGMFNGTSIEFNNGGTSKTLSSSGGKDIFIAKYSSSTGNNAWAYNLGGTLDDIGTAVDITSTGTILYAGFFASATCGDFDPGAGTQTLTNNVTNPGTEDGYFVSYTECTGATITTNPSNFTGCPGANITLTMAATGSGLTYQWQKGGVNISNGGNIAGATTTSLTITSAVVGDAGSYRCVVTSSCGSINTTAATVTINSAPSVTTHPTAQSVCSGTNVSFNVVATGAGLTYQWQKGGVSLSNNATYAGVNAATLNITAAAATEAGNYTCIVSGSCTPSVTSNSAALTISAAPSITTQPSAVASCISGNASFTVAATGASPTYQWKKNGTNMTDGGSVSGSTTATLTITGVVAGDAANYTCVVSGTCTPAATSNIAALTITSSPAITTHPASQSFCTGVNATFTVVASGSGLSYQWQKGGVNLSNGGNVSGATAATLTLTSVVAGDAGSYACIVTGACAPTATSNSATLTINSVPAISTQPTPVSICATQNASFSVVATGTGLTYQWQKDGVNISNNAIYSGVTTTSLSITAASVSEAGNYRCIVSGTCTPAATSNAVALTVGSTASISTNPTPVTICAGQNTTFSITTTGSGITYQWQKNGVNISNGGVYSGVTTSVLTLTALTSSEAGNYRCVINNACAGSLTSTAAALTVNSLPAITTQPTDVTICAATNVSFSVVATGTGVSYQWQKGGVNITDGGNVSGATTATLNITSASVSDAATYRCVVSGTCTPSINSNGAVLSVGSVASITTQPSPSTVCSGTNTSFTIVVSGTGVTYQWKKNGVDLVNGGRISGATSSVLNISGVLASDADVYSCVTGNACSSVLTSNTAALTVNSTPAISTHPTNVSVCSGSNASFTVVATGTGVSYQWKKNGVSITDGGSVSGALTSTLTITGVVSGDAASYTCQVSGTCTPAVTSNPATLTVANSITILSQPSSQSICSGTSAVFTINASGGSITYQWKKGGVDVVDGGTISGATTSTLTISSSVSGDAGSYTCVLNSTCGGSLTSTAAILLVNSSLTITSQPADVTTCAGNNASLSVTATGAGISYVWKKDGVTLTDGGVYSGATTSTLSITGATVANSGSYVCDLTGSCGVLSSNAATVTVGATTTITTQPSSASACPGSAIFFNVGASGTTLTYQWNKNGIPLSDGGNISGATTAILTVSSLSGSDEATYTCDVLGACGANQTSTGAVLTLATPPVITTQPISSTACVGQTISLDIIISNPTGAIYVWKKDGNTLSDGGSISGATTSTITLTGVALADAGSYTCEVSLSCTAATTSNTATVAVGAAGNITQQPINANICLNQGAVFSVGYSGSGATYQWQFKTGSNPFTAISNGGVFSGATSANLIISTAVLTEQGTYRCVITEGCGNVLNSNGAALIINTPQILVQPFSQSVCTGQPTFLSVTVSGQNLTYQWFKDGVAISNGSGISGATSASLTITNTQSANAGDYHCKITGVCAPPAVSDIATVTPSVCTGVDMAQGGLDMKIYPNPVVENAVLACNNLIDKNIQISIISMLGNIVYIKEVTVQQESEQVTLPMDQLPSAVYIVQVKVGEQVFIERVERLP